ncbi:MAG TPA: flagellar basal-body MS-ring/collar protein FliF [Stellaceae bacterium]|jgi:flagellar M-ring protein FliF|nr:flagellar basal-body MS-ring/collar protein FliF [Stellaceae bacterium]
MQSIARLGATRLVAIVGVGAAMVAFFVFLTTRIATPAMSLLYADLDLKDSAQIVQKLDAMTVPYQLRGEGGQILVPADQVARLRMAMAEQGLPRGGSVGYELFDKSDSFGSSTAAQGINQVRALEGELERTIAGLGPVQAARVHLVLPRRDLFARDSQEASASIVVKLRGAEHLSKGQVAAIQQVVASAVATLKPARVSVVDGAGMLLARGDGQDANAAGAGAEGFQADYETRVARNVEDMLQRSLGPGKARVDVRADIDFDRITTSSESFDPDGQVVRSTQTVTQNDDSTNGNDQPVTVTNNLPNGQAAATANGGRTKAARNEETINYEISKTTRSQVREAGDVKRLSVAVLVDGTYATKPDGTKEYAPRTPEELKQLTTLVRSAIGYNEKRGDTVEVVNLKFAMPEEPAPVAAPSGFLGFEKADLFRMGETLTLAVVALLVILLVVRPLIFKLLEGGGTAVGLEAAGLLADPGLAARPQLPPPAGMQAAMIPAQGANLPVPMSRAPAEQMIDIGMVEGRVAASSIKKIGEIVDKHPEEAVAIVRSWMYQAT